MLLTPPRVKLETDADLDIGVFGIATRLVARRTAAAGRTRREPQPGAGATMVYKAVAARARRAGGGAAGPVLRETATLTFDGTTARADRAARR